MFKSITDMFYCLPATKVTLKKQWHMCRRQSFNVSPYLLPSQVFAPIIFPTSHPQQHSEPGTGLRLVKSPATRPLICQRPLNGWLPVNNVSGVCGVTLWPGLQMLLDEDRDWSTEPESPRRVRGIHCFISGNRNLISFDFSSRQCF